VVEALCEGVLPTPLAAHARGCVPCASLLAMDRALEVEPPPNLELGEALRDALREARPVRRISAWVRAAPTALVTLGVLGMHRVVAPGHGLSPRAMVLVGGAAAGFALVFSRGADGVGSDARWRRGYPVAAACLAVVAAALRAPVGRVGAGVLSRAPSPGTAVDGVSQLSTAGADDVTATLATAVFVTLIAATTTLLGARRTTPNLPALSGATAGAAAALLGIASAHLGPLPAGGGVVLAHAVLVVVTAVCAAIVGRASLAP
jgi:hypothetical protein